MDLKQIVLGILLALLAYYDWKQRRCPNVLVLLGGIIGIYFAYTSDTMVSSIQSCVITFAFYLLFWIFGSISEGDVKTLAMIGLYEGFWNIAEYIIVASVMVCVWMLYRKFIRRRIDSIPMISFVFIAYIGFLIYNGGFALLGV